MVTATGGRTARTGFFSRLLRISLVVLAFPVLAIVFSVLNNNFSFPRLSRADFVKSLDRSLTASTNWATDQFISIGNSGDVTATHEGVELRSNSALAHMVTDCAAMSSDPRLQQLAILMKPRENPPLWAKMVDPTLVVHPVSGSESADLEEYQRWILHGLSPSDEPLSAVELADMFSPDKFRTGRATHQLLALYLYRKFNGSTPELERIMDRIENRIAAEAAFDFRVTDLYLQRIAFLLAAGRPDLVKPRWVERALTAQQSDGGWYYNWYGWGPHPFTYTFSDDQSVAHSTAQGIWLTHMLKYRYPQWIDKHYR
jgi:hypothetical protein